MKPLHALIDDREYSIEFEYEIVEVTNYANTPSRNPRKEAKRLERLAQKLANGELHQTQLTRCLIRDTSAPSPGDGTFPVVATGEVMRYYRDIDKHDRARKESLTRAAAALFPVITVDGDSSLDVVHMARHHRLCRALLWVAYFERPRALTPAAAIFPYVRLRLTCGCQEVQTAEGSADVDHCEFHSMMFHSMIGRDPLIDARMLLINAHVESCAHRAGVTLPIQPPEEWGSKTGGATS